MGEGTNKGLTQIDSLSKNTAMDNKSITVFFIFIYLFQWFL